MKFELPTFFYRIGHKYDMFLSFIRAKIFQLRHGFDPRDCWSLDYSLAKWLVPRLKHLRDNFNGMPMKPGGKMTKHGPEAFTSKEWKSILNKIIWSFEYILNEDDYVTKICYPKNYDFGFKTDGNDKIIWNDERKADFNKMKPYEERYKEGMDLFVKFYRSLWD